MRKSGILLHISSLPSPYGIGTMGKEAYDFVDYLVECDQKYWQILPVVPTGFGDSPYQSFSIFAGNPYFIDLDILNEEGLLSDSDYKDLDWYDNKRYVNYGKIYNNIFKVLKIASNNFNGDESDKYLKFIKENKFWLDDYALFMALKFENGGRPWIEWSDDLVHRKENALADANNRLSDEIQMWKFMQFKFFEQWSNLKQYANKNGIEIVGDIPIYVAYDSVEVWCEPELYILDKDLNPIEVAGCPPDCFTPLGQLWGNPLYNWDRMKKDKFSWWVKRIEFATTIYDVVRIDHFRGFDGYYAIPYSHKTAENGVWRDGPGIDLFNAIENEIGKTKIIAEDLGFITDSVEKLLEDTGFPGMKVLQFAFDPNADSVYLPQNYKDSNCVVYTGTHDSETITGWVKSATKEEIKFAMDYLDIKRKSKLPWAIIRLAWSSTADTAIAQMQDFLGLGSKARMNIPSTVGQNWRWRALKSDFSPRLAHKIKKLTKLCRR
ncbi:MAG: 4-alpha-glucanotransferase [Clostridiales bacterium]|nr:4-alpha-glucanotransferase [Clostridiales bacterium]